MPENTANESSDTLARTELALHLREFHHNGIWEEQKHFTWMISLILSAEVVAFGAGDFASATRDWLMFGSSVAGFVLTVIAIRIQRIEGHYFQNANGVFIRHFNRVFTEARDQLPEPPPPLAPDRASFRRTVARVAKGRAGVRDHFEVLLGAFGLVFVGLAVSALISRLS